MDNNNLKGVFVVQTVLFAIALVLIGGGAYYAGTKNVEKNSVVTVIPTQNPSITVVSPNGGEKLIIGNKYKITFNSTGDIGSKSIFLRKYSDDHMDIGSVLIGTTESNEYTFTVPIDTVPTRTDTPVYKIQVQSNKYNDGKGVSDESDDYFKIELSNTYADQPVINSISKSSGPVGTELEIKGTNLAGFESDLDAWIENSDGEVAFLNSIAPTQVYDGIIRVRIDARICKQNNNYRGGDCKSYMDIVPGEYYIYTMPWGNISNKVKFTVTDSPTSYQVSSYGTQGKCGLNINNPSANSTIKFPLTVSGTVDNSNYEELGCRWIISEGQAAVAKLYYNNNGWIQVGSGIPINFTGYSNNKAIFTKVINFTNNINLPSNTPMKIVFEDVNEMDGSFKNTFELPIYFTN